VARRLAAESAIPASEWCVAVNHSPLQVVLAQPRGFGAGVVRAIQIVERAIEKHDPPVYLRHEIVQNKYVIQSLKTVADVARLARLADTPRATVTQSTQSGDDTRDIILAPEQRFSDIPEPNARDICYATQNRQSGVRDPRASGRRIIVPGASNCADCSRVREIGNEVGVAGYLVADGSELNPEWLMDATIGVTAGASAPEVLVDDVIEALRRIGPVTVSVLPGREEFNEFAFRPN
jgi:4-hydroxy-3-methylbut-2-enyl diphosphate reductase IspH